LGRDGYRSSNWLLYPRSGAFDSNQLVLGDRTDFSFFNNQIKVFGIFYTAAAGEQVIPNRPPVSMFVHHGKNKKKTQNKK
jgi:hypothetical protein